MDAPVRPGDVLRVRVTVLEASVSRSKPDRGLVRTQIEALNQRDEVVLIDEGDELHPATRVASRGAPSGVSRAAPNALPIARIPE